MRTDSKIKKKAKESYFQLWHFLKMEKQNTFIIYSDQQNMKKKRFVPERERHMADLSIRHDGNGDIEILPFKIKKGGEELLLNQQVEIIRFG